MTIFENFKSAIFNILSSKMRTILTTLGIIIGIASVITITAIGQGFENQINETFSAINAEAATVGLNNKEKVTDKDRFTLDDIPDLQAIENVEFACPDYSSYANITLKNPNQEDSVTVKGAIYDTQDMDRIKILSGRFINMNDNESLSKVCVIDTTLAKQVFGREDVLGEILKGEFLASGSPDLDLQIVGLFEGSDDLFSTSSIYIPITTLMDTLGNTKELYNSIKVEVFNTDLLSVTELNIKKILNANHGNNIEMYTIFVNLQILETMQGSIQIFTIFIGLVAGISLLVGGIGIMNIMLVTVTERTREIGIRKSLGATSKDIKLQFLIEAVCISLLGGFMGVTLGYICSYIAGEVLIMTGNDLEPAVSEVVVIGSMLISSFIGVIFGVYPAGKAAKLDPIEALRFE